MARRPQLGGAGPIEWFRQRFGRANQQVRDMFTGESAIILLIMAVVLSIVVIILYIVYIIKSGSQTSNDLLYGNVSNLGNTTDKYANGNARTLAIPQNDARAYTTSFWLYVSPKYTTTQHDKMIFAMGPDGNTTTMLVYADRNFNQLYVTLFTNAVKQGINVDKGALSGYKSQGTGYLTFQVNYLPLQRWVNLAVVVNETAATLLLDGQIYSVMTVYDIPPAADTRYIINNLIEGTAGLTYQINSASAPPNTEMYLANLRVYNVALDQREVERAYSNGPYAASWLAWLGLGKYKLQWPVAKVGSESSSCSS